MAIINLKNILIKNSPADTDTTGETTLDRVQIATCVVLLEVAKSDYEFSSMEKVTVEMILKKEFQIPDETIEELMEIAKRSREESTDLWEFTTLINKNYSREERIKIIEAAWKVIYADKKLDKYEDHLIHVLARLLRLRHNELIDAKLKVLYGDQS